MTAIKTPEFFHKQDELKEFQKWLKKSPAWGRHVGGRADGQSASQPARESQSASQSEPISQLARVSQPASQPESASQPARAIQPESVSQPEPASQSQ